MWCFSDCPFPAFRLHVTICLYTSMYVWSHTLHTCTHAREVEATFCKSVSEMTMLNNELTLFMKVTGFATGAVLDRQLLRHFCKAGEHTLQAIAINPFGHQRYGITKSSISCQITPSSLVEVDRRFGGNIFIRNKG
jgi:hypothetical protein